MMQDNSMTLIYEEIVSATEKWAVTYLENEKNYFETIDKLLAE